MIVELENINKVFRDGSGGVRTVLNNLSLHVETGAYVAITGVSGTGKTTLLNILGTMLRPDAGRYHFNGMSIPYDDENLLLQIRNQQIGFMFQDFRLVPQFTAWQNILLPTFVNKSHDTREYHIWAEALVKKMGIDSILHQLPETLSGGEKSRVALCRALVMRPSLLLADEPTGQLDCQNADETASIFKEVNEQLGMTIILATHSERLAQTAKVHYSLKDGQL